MEPTEIKPRVVVKTNDVKTNKVSAQLIDDIARSTQDVINYKKSLGFAM